MAVQSQKSTRRAIRMTGERALVVRSLTLDVLQDIVKFKSTHDVLAFVREDGVVDYNNLEMRLHSGYPVRASAVEATRSNLNGKFAFEDGGFLHTELALAPEDISGQLWRYPVDAASATYVFARFEVYGQDLADLLRPEPLSKTWHRSIPERKELRGNEKEFRNGLAADLNVPASRISRRLLQELQQLKASRNRIVHEANGSVRFDAFHAAVVRLICRLHFLAVPGDGFITVAPWPDLEKIVSRPSGAGVFHCVD